MQTAASPSPCTVRQESRAHSIFRSYPQEWSFAQFRDAALVVLEAQEAALAHGMELCEARGSHVQFRGCMPVLSEAPVLVESSSRDWVAHEQFCRHFLAPLLLMSHVGLTANRLLASFSDGIPLDAACRMLPRWGGFDGGALAHLRRVARRGGRTGSGTGLELVKRLRNAVRSIPARRGWSHWRNTRGAGDFYPVASLLFKQRVVRETVERLHPDLVYDLGAGGGEYSRAVTAGGSRCVSCEEDPIAVDLTYQRGQAQADASLVPLVANICSPGLGGFGVTGRPRADLVLLLGHSHHLRMTSGMPFIRMAEILHQTGQAVLLEFVHPEDTVLRGMARERRGLPADYSAEGLAGAFGTYFRLVERVSVPEMARELYLFRGA